jgi:hypothetical protein
MRRFGSSCLIVLAFCVREDLVVPMGSLDGRHHDTTIPALLHYSPKYPESLS